MLLGDFNCAPASPLHRFLTSGHLRASLRCEGAWDGQPNPNPNPNQARGTASDLQTGPAGAGGAKAADAAAARAKAADGARRAETLR